MSKSYPVPKAQPAITDGFVELKSVERQSIMARQPGADRGWGAAIALGFRLNRRPFRRAFPFGRITASSRPWSRSRIGTAFQCGCSGRERADGECYCEHPAQIGSDHFHERLFPDRNGPGVRRRRLLFAPRTSDVSADRVCGRFRAWLCPWRPLLPLDCPQEALKLIGGSVNSGETGEGRSRCSVTIPRALSNRQPARTWQINP